ncbi:hypothetical protein QBC34DRAFT_402098 [Podospora aff. communis PSN243]|uniref:Uncharacterized protein n=1 Tax=Podospora aff. communis PSN243 TaxID=3040156 RepID=A0AAV9GTI9_9PEZI|nr:hypothetical protein QBC34DRAFT_402098 [Podospora aff. communis PSN243]
MKFSFFPVFTSLLTVASAVAAAGPSRPKPPKAPGLEYLYTVNITGGDAAIIGQGPRGFRIVVPILRGNFAGPKLKGTVLPIGGDWALIDANNINGTLVPDVRQTFKTDDGHYIQVFETGATQPDGSAWVRLTFETGSEKYYWMNSIIAIGILRLLGPSDLTIDAWQMTAP